MLTGAEYPAAKSNWRGMRGGLLCRQIPIALWWKEQYLLLQWAAEMHISIQAPAVAAVKKSWYAEIGCPGQRATLRKVYERRVGDCRKEGLATATVLSGSGGIWMWMTEHDKRKWKGKNEYLNIMSKNNNDHSCHWHAVWLSEETKPVSYLSAYQFISPCDRRGC